MKTMMLLLAGTLAFAAPASLKAEQRVNGRFAFAGAIPSDVYLYVATRHNSERAFLYDYWNDVFNALKDSGVGGDVADLVGMAIDKDSEEGVELERVKQRVLNLLDGVDWKQLIGTEAVFAERFSLPKGLFEHDPPIMVTEMVMLSRGRDGTSAKQFDGLSAILDALVEEVNKAAGAEVLTVERTTRLGAKVASVNLLAALPGAPPLPLSVAVRDDVVIMGLRPELFDDVLALLNGSSSKNALDKDARFQAAFAQLPPAEDLETYFDMQALMVPIRTIVEGAVNTLSAPHDVYRNSGQNPEASKINRRALAAYRNHNIDEALSLVKKAHETAPEDSLITYNLACFSALAGHRKAALQALHDAVEGGFYASRKIASDSDLASVRETAAFKAAIERAGALSEIASAKDVVQNTPDSGEARTLIMQAWQVYEDKDYEQGLKLCEQAYAVAPHDSRVLYALACFHSLLGHEDKALDFLEEAVKAGFYSPRHIRSDPDLERLRGHERYVAAYTLAEKIAAEFAKEHEADNKEIILRLIDRIADVVEMFDYSAAVETTDGYSTWSESVAVLVPDAKERPIYPVFGTRPPLTNFEKYLPQETLSFSVASGIDLGELYTFIEDTIRLAGPKGEELLTKWDAIQKGMGVDIRKDVLGWIDGDSISITLSDNGGSVRMMKVTDEKAAREKVAAAIEFVSTAITKLSSENPAFAGLAMLGMRTSPTEHAQLQGFQNLYIGMSPAPAVWGVAEGYLIFGSSADAVALCLSTAKGDHPGIRHNAQAMSEAIVPDGGFVAVSLSDERGLGDELAMTAGMVSMSMGMAGAFIPDPKVQPVISKIAGMLSKLTPVLKKINFFKSKANLVTFDGQRWHIRSVTHYFSPEEHAAREGESGE